MPVNASFGASVRVQAADSDAGLAVPFANCAPNGCFADFALQEEGLKKLRAASGTVDLSFADANGHNVTAPISFDGISAMFDALTKK